MSTLRLLFLLTADHPILRNLRNVVPPTVSLFFISIKLILHCLMNGSVYGQVSNSVVHIISLLFHYAIKKCHCLVSINVEHFHSKQASKHNEATKRRQAGRQATRKDRDRQTDRQEGVKEEVACCNRHIIVESANCNCNRTVPVRMMI